MTSIALNMALHVGLRLRKTVAIFSLEMSREQLTMRLLSRAALIPLQNLLTGQLDERQWRSLSDAAQSLSMADIRIDDNPTLTVSDMNAQCRRVPQLGLVVVDYLQLMQSAGSGDPARRRPGRARTPYPATVRRPAAPRHPAAARCAGGSSPRSGADRRCNPAAAPAAPPRACA